MKKLWLKQSAVRNIFWLLFFSGLTKFNENQRNVVVRKEIQHTHTIYIYIYTELGCGTMHSMGHLYIMGDFFILKVYYKNIYILANIKMR
jgi:hypothetical protein